MIVAKGRERPARPARKNEPEKRETYFREAKMIAEGNPSRAQPGAGKHARREPRTQNCASNPAENAVTCPPYEYEG